MTTIVRICNIALSHLGGRGRISSLAETSEEARQCALHYESARDEALRAVPWPFATRRKALAASVEETPPGWRRAFEYPSDCIAPRRIEAAARGAASARFEVAASESLDRRLILTDEEAPVLVYTARVTNPALYDPLFASALALRLAASLAVPLSGRHELAATMMGLYQRMLEEAAATALNEASPVEYRDAEWIRARG